MKDDFYYRYLTKMDVFAPVFAILTKYEGRNNMVNSAVVDLLEFVRVENVKSLVEHIVEKYVG